jgi:hypothetical protein
MKSFWAIFAILLCAGILSCKGDKPSSPNTGGIRGTITDASTSEPIIAASISTTPPTASVTTDSIGDYSIDGIEPGQYIVIVNKNNYITQHVGIAVTAGNSTRCDIALSTEPSNNPPNQANNPFPPDAALHQMISLILSWSCSDPDGDPLTYEVKLDSVNPPIVSVAAHLADTSLLYDDFRSSTTYYWQVIAEDNRGATSASAVWRLTTATILLNEDFEDGTLNQYMSIQTTGSFNDLPGIKNTTSFGSTKAFGFGLSSCPADCYYDYETRLIINFPSQVYITSIAFKDMEMYGNWGSGGRIYLDGVAFTGDWIDFSRLPYNDNQADQAFRSKYFSVDTTASQIILYVGDITTQSEEFIDDLIITGD